MVSNYVMSFITQLCAFVKHFFAPQADNLLVLPDNTPDDADDLGISAVDEIIVVIFRHQPHLAVFPQQALNGGFVFDAGHHDLAIVGALLGADHYFVTVQNARIDHTVATDPEGKAAGLMPGHGAFLIFNRQDGDTGGDHTHHRDLAGTGRGDQSPLAALGTGIAQQALFLQRLEVIADGSCRTQANCRTDLPDRGGLAVLLDELVYIIHNQFCFIAGSGHKIASKIRT